MIKLISFDFWDTLFKGDPRHAEVRVSYLSAEYNLDPEFVKRTISETKRWCDLMGEQTLTCIPPPTQLYFLGKNLGIDDFPIGKVRQIFFQALMYYPPICLLGRDTIDSIRTTLGMRCCISCNTGFMGKRELEWILSQSEIKDSFEFAIFSEQIRVFKPNPLWIGSLQHGWYEQTFNMSLSPQEIIHVGDNDATDGQLARNTGMHFVKVKPKNPDFSPIFEIIEKEKNG